MARWGVWITGEKEIVELLKERFRGMGAQVLYEGGRRSGPDLVIYDSAGLMVIEVRGVPTEYRVRGKDKGKRKSEATRKSQFRIWIGEVLVELMEREHSVFECIEKGTCRELKGRGRWLGEVISRIGLERLRTMDITYIAAFGYHKEYSRYFCRRIRAIMRLRYRVWLVRESGEIEDIVNHCTA